jgi:hypothetical protein
LRSLRQKGHLGLKSLENVGGDFAFVGLWSDYVFIDFPFLDKFDSFSEVSI